MTFISNEDLYKKLEIIEQLLLENRVKKIEQELKEVSLQKACKLLNRGNSFVIDKIKCGELPASEETITNKNGKKITRYRIRLNDLKKFQDDQLSITIKDKAYMGNRGDLARKIINQFHNRG